MVWSVRHSFEGSTCGHCSPTLGSVGLAGPSENKCLGKLEVTPKVKGLVFDPRFLNPKQSLVLTSKQYKNCSSLLKRNGEVKQP